MIVIPFVFVSDPRGWDPAAGRERFAVWDSDCGGGEADPERHGVQSWPSVHLPAQWQTGKYTCRALTRSVRETVTRLFSVRLSLFIYSLNFTAQKNTKLAWWWRTRSACLGHREHFILNVYTEISLWRSDMINVFFYGLI